MIEKTTPNIYFRLFLSERSEQQGNLGNYDSSFLVLSFAGYDQAKPGMFSISIIFLIPCIRQLFTKPFVAIDILDLKNSQIDQIQKQIAQQQISCGFCYLNAKCYRFNGLTIYCQFLIEKCFDRKMPA